MISKESKTFGKVKNIEIENRAPKSHAGTVAVEYAIQTLKNIIFDSLESNIGLTEVINRDLRVMRFKIHTGLKMSPFELHHGRKPRTRLTNVVKDNKSYLSDRTTLNVSVPPKQITINVARNEKGEVWHQIIMARKGNYLAARHTNHQKEDRPSRLAGISNIFSHFLRKAIRKNQ